MRKKHQCLIKQDSSHAELFEGMAITLSRPVNKDVIITMRPANSDEPVRNSQRRLARMWAADQAKAGVGEFNLENDCYWFFKSEFLAPMKAADDLEFSQDWDSLKVYVMMGQEEKYRRIGGAFLSINNCNVKQVSAALKQWQQWMNQHGVTYRDPEDYKLALQVEFYERDGGIK